MYVKEDIAGVLDYALLNRHPYLVKPEQIDAACQFVMENKLHAICVQHIVRSDWRSIEYIKDKFNVRVVAVVGWPYGTNDESLNDAMTAVDLGADEVDYTMDWQSFATYATSTTGLFGELYRVRTRISKPLKIIIQAPLLKHTQVIEACEVCADVGVDFVKTSTGFIPGSETTIEDVWLCKVALKGTPVKIKVSGGVDVFNIQQFLDLGVDRIGSSKFRELYE